MGQQSQDIEGGEVVKSKRPKPTFARGDRVVWGASRYTITSTNWNAGCDDYEYGLANTLNRVFAWEVKKEETP